ncbi:GlgB N-terminal domain-containing protein, partial [Bradyrhizobium sp.]
MTHLSPEAFAIIEGRHADPFRYLGQHDVDGRTVIRAFLPEASRVEAVGDNGEV